MSFLSKLKALDAVELIPSHIVHKDERLDFFVKILTAGEVEAISERNMGIGRKKKTQAVNFRSRCISLAVVDESGKPQIPLNQALLLSNAMASKLFKAVSEHNDFGGDDEDDDDGVTAEEKSSPETHDDD